MIISQPWILFARPQFQTYVFYSGLRGRQVRFQTNRFFFLPARSPGQLPNKSVFFFACQVTRSDFKEARFQYVSSLGQISSESVLGYSAKSNWGNFVLMWVLGGSSLWETFLGRVLLAFLGSEHIFQASLTSLPKHHTHARPGLVCEVEHFASLGKCPRGCLSATLVIRKPGCAILTYPEIPRQPDLSPLRTQSQSQRNYFPPTGENKVPPVAVIQPTRFGKYTQCIVWQSP